MKGICTLLFSLILLAGLPAHASLTTFQTYNGSVYYSSDGLATSGGSGTISASVPMGSTVIAAYLYTATSNLPGGTGADSMLNGTAVAYGGFVENTGGACCNLGIKRADVTSIVKPIIDGGPGGVYNFTVTEALTGNQDGEALVVVYSNPSLPESTVAILDGFSATGGDAFTATFTNPLDPTAPGFFAEMALGINFSCGDPPCGGVQSSNVTVNGTLISSSAGNYDDSDVPPPGNAANGRLLTVGGFNDPFSPLLPSYDVDHERYDIEPYVTAGSTTITVSSSNPTNDDNIFLAVFASSGTADVGPIIPEPSTYLMLGGGFLMLAWKIKRRRAS